MDILEVYALNIQPKQIARFLPKERRNTEEIEAIRDDFLIWLREEQEDYDKFRDALGLPKRTRYSDQIAAWDNYKRFYEDWMDDEESDGEPFWLLELKRILDEKVMSNLGNYNEFGGQL